MATVERLLTQLGAKESKLRAEALQDALGKLERLPDLEDNLVGLCVGLAANVCDNNIKVSNTCCELIVKLADTVGEQLSESFEPLCEPLGELLGNAKPAPREHASNAALALMAAVGPSRVLEAMMTPKLLNHKNWRVREGLLTVYVAQADKFGRDACVMLDALLPKACDALNDAQPDVRKAGIEALAVLGSQVGLQRVLGQLAKRADVRQAHIASVQQRCRELSGGDVVPAPSAGSSSTPVSASARRASSSSSSSSSSSAGAVVSGAPPAARPSPQQQQQQQQQPVARRSSAAAPAPAIAEGDDEAEDDDSAMQTASSAAGAGRPGGSGQRATGQAPPQPLARTRPAAPSANSSVNNNGTGMESGGIAAGGIRRASGSVGAGAATATAPRPGSGGGLSVSTSSRHSGDLASGPPSVNSYASAGGGSSNRTAATAAGGGPQAARGRSDSFSDGTPVSASSGGGGVNTSFSSFGNSSGGGNVLQFEIQRLSLDDVSADPDVQALCGINASPVVWRPGVAGSLMDDVGKVRPLPCSSLRDAAKIVEDFVSLCSNSNSEWKARSAAIDKLRGLIAGGALGIEGFTQLLPRLRDPLNSQLQDLRSSIVRQTSVAIAELSSATAHTSAFEPLAEALMETLIRQTSVTIAIISSSASSAAETIVRNARNGFHRVLPRLCSLFKLKAAQPRLNAAQCLLCALRTWPASCIDRHGDEVQLAISGLLHDADGQVRQLGRFCFWSFASLFSDRGDAIADRLDEAKIRQLESDQHAAYERLIASLCEPIAVLLSAPHESVASSGQSQQSAAYGSGFSADGFSSGSNSSSVNNSVGHARLASAKPAGPAVSTNARKPIQQQQQPAAGAPAAVPKQARFADPPHQEHVLPYEQEVEELDDAGEGEQHRYEQQEEEVLEDDEEEHYGGSSSGSAAANVASVYKTYASSSSLSAPQRPTSGSTYNSNGYSQQVTSSGYGQQLQLQQKPFSSTGSGNGSSALPTANDVRQRPQSGVTANGSARRVTPASAVSSYMSASPATASASLGDQQQVQRSAASSSEHAISQAVSRAVAAVTSSDPGQLRSRIWELILALVTSHATSSASVERGYGVANGPDGSDAAGASASLMPAYLRQNLPPINPEFEYCPQSVHDPVLLDNLSPPAAAAVADAIRSGSIGRILSAALLPAAVSRGPSSGSQAQLLQLDGAALWFSLLDAGVDLHQPIAAEIPSALPLPLVEGLRQLAAGNDTAAAADVSNSARHKRIRVPIVNDADEDDFADIDVIPVYAHALTSAVVASFPHILALSTSNVQQLQAAGQRCLQVTKRALRAQDVAELAFSVVVAGSAAAASGGPFSPQIRRQALSLLCALGEGEPAEIREEEHDDPEAALAAAEEANQADAFEALSIFGDDTTARHGEAGSGKLYQLLSAAAQVLSRQQQSNDDQVDASWTVEGAAGALDVLCELVEQWFPGVLSRAVSQLPLASTQTLALVVDPEGIFYQLLLGNSSKPAAASTPSQPLQASRQPQPQQQPAPQASPLSLLELASLSPHAAPDSAASVPAPPAHHNHSAHAARTAAAAPAPSLYPRSSHVNNPAAAGADASPFPPSLNSFSSFASVTSTSGLGGSSNSSSAYLTPVGGAAAAANTYSRTAGAVGAASALATSTPGQYNSASGAAVSSGIRQQQQQLPSSASIPVLPLTAEHLRQLLDTYASPDRSRRIGGLHFLGRSVDGHSTPGPDGRPRIPPRPTSHAELQLPPPHCRDPGWVAAWDRVLDLTLSFVPLQLDPGTGQADVTMSQTAMSVLRKLYRSHAAYGAHKAPHVMSALFGAMGPGVPRDIQAVLEKTVEEVGDRLLLPDQLQLLATALSNAPLENVPALNAAVRGIQRLLSQASRELLMDELAAGSLLTAAGRAAGAGNPMVRKAGFTLFVALALVLGEPTLQPFAAKVLSAPQLRLLRDQVAAARSGGGTVDAVAVYSPLG